jgi:predicted MFS family arabinose efflux permease
LTGWIHDKKGLRFTVIICDIAAVVMVLLLALSAPTAFGMTCAMGYGIVSSLALPLETVMLPLIAATLFGEKDFVKILGVLVSANSAGYALSAPLCNLVFDITGSYHFCFYIMGALIIFVTVLFQLGLRAAKRRQSMAAEANT